MSESDCHLNAVWRYCHKCDHKQLVNDPASFPDCPTCKIPMKDQMSPKARQDKADRLVMDEWLETK